ncbi:MAG: TetR/AcrR family transcriptional regulator [Candidatus Lokiarchaeota archaeon]|nr:TetR/AcrR family transcriptional regulator [Candidatus Lokiarchaeota archaeon]
MEKSKKKKIIPRARAPEKKAEQFNKILEAGKDLFVKYGSHGFSLRALAKLLNMSQTNVYNYVQSKRELWIAIRKKYYGEFQDGLNRLIGDYQGSYTDLFFKIAEFFLEFASVDFNRFAMMFLISAPPSNKIGPLEKNYKPFQIMKYISVIVEKAVIAKKIIKTEAIERLFYIYGVLLGAAKVEADLKLRENITEPIKLESYIISAKEYRKFALEQIRDLLEKNVL